MKKSLSKVLARMARDGDAETVAEIIEEMLEPETAPSGDAGEAAEKAAQTAAGIGGSPIGRTARSIVCAAVINAGIDMAMQGAGAVGSVLGGKDDLFKELGDSELV